MTTKAKWVSSLCVGILAGGAMFLASRSRTERLVQFDEPSLSPWVSVGCAAIWFVAMVLVLFGVPALWRGFLRCIRDLSRAVRGKDE